MDFRGDPGAVQFGNFINYYKFHSPEDRISILPKNKDVWMGESNGNDVDAEPYLLLDVGCNSGELTQLLWQLLTEITGREVHVIGIDLDPTIIERAQESNEHREYISYACVDIMDGIATDTLDDWLSIHNREKFDAVCCFSVTMWIHLNHNDQGLKEFLTRLANLSALLVMEPQPWKCYQHAQRRMKKAGDGFPLFLELKWRSSVEDEIQTFLENDVARHKVHECSPSKWQRRICFYR